MTDPSVQIPNFRTSFLYKQRVQTVLADSVDPDQTALEQYDQGLHCLPVILIKKHKVNVQAFP